MALYTDKEALAYHSAPRKGKVEVIPTVQCETQKDLSVPILQGLPFPA